ncbi:hypothetical protein NDR87_14140 [Nocardia sp. CDC159]|uniref:Uncharacterized protein n=1 Tax=Nocardia pulmonis TaxID=2951408 RepID=A0A9X2E9S0_9NOCA|nr:MULTISPECIES: hypothetical protein [Nocardia]MCM6774436.1 hypothetical protein [Nocardia pulmonis]MCM6787498.1 hypothetical protein [Nocardia sp. CDC159]
MRWLRERRGLTDPAYYQDAGSPDERKLLADFALHYQLNLVAPFAETPVQAVEFGAQANDLARRWIHHPDPEWRRMWAQLSTAAADWTARPEQARREFDHLAIARHESRVAIDERTWRVLRLAREVTGHGEGQISGSEQDAHRRHTDHDLTVTANPAPDVDRRTAVEKTLGAPRTGGPDAPLSLERVGQVIVATEQALADEEHASEVDRRDQLLSESVRHAPIVHDYSRSDDARWEQRQAKLLRQVQDLTAEHASVADGFEGRLEADQQRIMRLEQLRAAAADARADALRAGVSPEAVDHAYLLGRDGIYWSIQPADPRLGRIAQLTEQRDQARTEVDHLQARIAELQAALDTRISPGLDDPPLPAAAHTTAAPGPTATGAGIEAAIDIALTDTTDTAWNAERGDLDPPPPSPARAVDSLELNQ